jgi:hypothetical protein
MKVSQTQDSAWARVGNAGKHTTAEVAGYPGVERCTNLAELTSFYVAEAARGRGLGRV